MRSDFKVSASALAAVGLKEKILSSSVHSFWNFYSFLCCLSPELKNKLDCWTLKAMVKPQNIKAMLVVQWLLVTTVGSRLKEPGFDS